MSGVLDSLGGMSVAEFVRDYWQQRPVLLRGVFPPDFCPLDGDDVLDLAGREEADSRLIISEEWPPELLHGPFEPEELEDLPDEEWTVLVQEVDRLVPEAARVLEAFRFIPNWRVDDLMVSWAAPGGGVGAHTDQYDVFLIQGLGHRRWEIETTANPDPEWRPDSEVAVLASFEPDAVWELEPGDVLYLPPHVAHNGIALTPCMTLSVGFRAPSAAEVLEDAVAYLNESESGTARTVAAGSTSDPGRIGDDVLRRLREQVRALLAEDEQLDRFIARSLTEPARGRSAGLEEDYLEMLPERGVVEPVSVAQAAYFVSGDAVLLVVGGRLWSLPLEASADVAALTGPSGLRLRPDLDAGLRGILEKLAADGTLRRRR